MTDPRTPSSVRKADRPCSPAILSFTIHHALQVRSLAKQSARLLAKTRRQRLILKDLEARYPGIADIKLDNRGAIVLDEDDQDIDELIRSIEQEVG